MPTRGVAFICRRRIEGSVGSTFPVDAQEVIIVARIVMRDGIMLTRAHLVC